MPIDAFWWDWWVNVAVAAGTIGAVVIALFGQAFRAKFFPPQLTLRLGPREGEATQEVDASRGQTRPARYYHLRVQNNRRWAPASDVLVVLLRVEVPGPTGELVVQWTGDVPFKWRHPQLFPSGRSVGPEATADFCSVSFGEEAGAPVIPRFRLHLALIPNPLSSQYTTPTTLVLTVQARGAEADSSPVRIRIAWDGQWHVGQAEMQRHLVIEELLA